MRTYLRVRTAANPAAAADGGRDAISRAKWLSEPNGELLNLILKTCYSSDRGRRTSLSKMKVSTLSLARCGFMYVPDPALALTEMYRALKGDGPTAAAV